MRPRRALARRGPVLFPPPFCSGAWTRRRYGLPRARAGGARDSVFRVGVCGRRAACATRVHRARRAGWSPSRFGSSTVVARQAPHPFPDGLGSRAGLKFGWRCAPRCGHEPRGGADRSRRSRGFIPDLDSRHIFRDVGRVLRRTNSSAAARSGRQAVGPCPLIRGGRQAGAPYRTSQARTRRGKRLGMDAPPRVWTIGVVCSRPKGLGCRSRRRGYRHCHRGAKSAPRPGVIASRAPMPVVGGRP